MNLYLGPNPVSAGPSQPQSLPITLGRCADGQPLAFRRPRSLVALAAAGAGKTGILQNAAYSSGLPAAVFSDNYDEWEGLGNTLYAGGWNLGAIRAIDDLAQLVENRLNGYSAGSPFLILLDHLNAAQEALGAVSEILSWLITYGPQAGVSVLAAANPTAGVLAVNPAAFQSRLYGHLPLPAALHMGAPARTSILRPRFFLYPGRDGLVKFDAHINDANIQRSVNPVYTAPYRASQKPATNGGGTQSDSSYTCPEPAYHPASIR